MERYSPLLIRWDKVREVREVREMGEMREVREVYLTLSAYTNREGRQALKLEWQTMSVHRLNVYSASSIKSCQVTARGRIRP